MGHNIRYRFRRAARYARFAYNREKEHLRICKELYTVHHFELRRINAARRYISDFARGFKGKVREKTEICPEPEYVEWCFLKNKGVTCHQICE